MDSKISDRVYSLCTSKESVSSYLAQNPSVSPGEAAKELYYPNGTSMSAGQAPDHRDPTSREELQRAYDCGRWDPKNPPSDLFLRIFHDSLIPLQHDPLLGVCSPSLVGSCGVMPLTIVGPLHDICRHMSNLIARAEKEVFLATNYWMDSDASKLITDSLKELSRRAGARGERAVVKIIYDRGSIKQLFDSHQLVDEAEYTGSNVRLPSKEEAPNLDLEVVNYHRPLLGTFHAKFMVVDRKIGIVQSNNIQDNDNMEMMCHVEGPIVDSLYDTLLISWDRALNPTSPSKDSPAILGGLKTFNEPSFQGLFDQQGNVHMPEAGGAASSRQVVDAGKKEQLTMHVAGDPHYDPDIASEVVRMHSVMTPRDGETHSEVVARHLNQSKHQDREPTAPPCEPSQEMTPYIPHSIHSAFPIALVNRKPYGAANHLGVYMPQNEAFLSAVRNATRSVFIQTPNLNAGPLLPELLAAVRRGIEVTYYVCLGYNDAGELLPFQGGHNEMVASKLYTDLGDDTEAKSRLHVHYYVGKDQNRPIHNKFKSRSCHIKLMIVDDHIGIMGSGNQDTQTWFHSQEVNIMIDSSEVVGKWVEAIDRNQNTRVYGKASQKDGIWRDEDGNEAPGAIGKNPGRFGWATGIIGAVQLVRAAGLNKAGWNG